MPRIDDGHPTIINFPGAGITFWEKEVTPPGMDSGGPNDVTTMRNITFRTKSPKRLITLTQMKLKVAYDPAVYTTISAQIGINQVIVIAFPDTTTMTFWGWLDKFTPDNIREGEQPTAEITIECSNHNNANPPVESPIIMGP
jgi:hypothetical protein